MPIPWWKGCRAMRKQEVMGLLFSNMHDDSVRELTAGRALGSVPFGGRYRLIDFALSNMVNAGISKVGIITKNNYQSLMDHLGSGKAWDLSRKNEGLYILPPYGSSDQLYEGRIASLSGITPFPAQFPGGVCHPLRLPCVVGNIDYSRLLEAHVASGGGDHHRLPARSASRGPGRYGPPGGGERPGSGCPAGRLHSGRLRLQLRAVCDAEGFPHAGSGRGRQPQPDEFLSGCAPAPSGKLEVFGYRVPEYAVPITSLDGYFRANMALLQPEVRGRCSRSTVPIHQGAGQLARPVRAARQ